MKKTIIAVIAILTLNCSFASYRIYKPLEEKLGGSLPDGTIKLGNITPPTPTTPEPELTCVYEEDITFWYFENISSIVFMNNELVQDANNYNLDSFTYNGINYIRGKNISGNNYEICH